MVTAGGDRRVVFDEEPSALKQALGVLRCPVCRESLHPSEPSVVCEAGHSFDIARHGYLHLAAGRPLPNTGDTAEMVAARVSFLSRDHYAPVGEELAGLISHLIGRFDHHGADPHHVVDLAGGTGHYLNRVLDAVPRLFGVNVDVSKFALRRAARAHPRAAAVAADAWGELPFRDGVIGVVLSVFGPRNIPEIQRILRPGGWFVVVTPTGGHLRELIEPLGLLRVDDRKQNRLDEQLTDFELVPRPKTIEYSTPMNHDDLEQLVSMGPSARHLTPNEIAHRIGVLPDPQLVTVSVRVATYASTRGA